jgi:hypothetical protein
MVLPFLPENRTQALSLLRTVNDDPDQLTKEQQQAIRQLYFLDDDRAVTQLIRDGEITIPDESFTVPRRRERQHSSTITTTYPLVACCKAMEEKPLGDDRL